MKYIVVVLLVIFFSCDTQIKTKEEYLKSYTNLIYEVKSNWKKYTLKDWEQMSLKNDLYSITYYKKFHNKLTQSERLRVKRIDFAFHFYKGDIYLSSFLNNDYEEILSDIFFEFINIISKTGIFLKDFRNEYSMVLVDKLLSKEY